MNYEKLKSHGNSALDIVKENYTWSQIADKYIKLGTLKVKNKSQFKI